MREQTKRARIFRVVVVFALAIIIVLLGMIYDQLARRPLGQPRTAHFTLFST